MVSRALDFQIAEKVLGISCECPRSPGSMCRMHDCAMYSQDIQAANAVVETMRRDGFSFKAWQPAQEMGDYAKVSFVCGAGPCPRHGNPHHNHHGAYDVDAATLPLAICKAALVALPKDDPLSEGR